MPYSVWDLAQPGDLDDISLGDNAIRELKQQIAERMNSVSNGTWSTATADGEFKIDGSAIEGAGSFDSGLDAAKPDPATVTFWFSTDTDTLYVKEGVAYTAVSGGTSAGSFSRGTVAALPNPATTDFYYAEDTNALYVKEGVAYVLVATGTGGTVTNVSWASMKKQVWQTTLTVAGVATGDTIHLALIQIAGAVGDNILIGAKVHAKKSSEGAYSASYSWRGPATGLAAGYGAANAAGDVFVSLLGVVEQQNGANIDHYIAIGCRNNSGGVLTINFAPSIYLLAMS